MDNYEYIPETNSRQSDVWITIYLCHIFFIKKSPLNREVKSGFDLGLGRSVCAAVWAFFLCRRENSFAFFAFHPVRVKDNSFVEVVDIFFSSSGFFLVFALRAIENVFCLFTFGLFESTLVRRARGSRVFDPFFSEEMHEISPLLWVLPVGLATLF